jgi:hypothetical protein
MYKNDMPKLAAAVETVDVLARTVVDPHDHKPIRLPTFPAIERTSVLPFISTSQMTVSAPVAPANLGSYALVVRSPVVPVWTTQTITVTGGISFSFDTGSGAVAVPTTVGESMDVRNLHVGAPRVNNNVWTTWIGLAVDSAEEYWWWAPPNANVFYAMQCTSAPGPGLWNVEFEYTRSFSIKDTFKINRTMGFSGNSLITSAILSDGFFIRPLVMSAAGTAAVNLQLVSSVVTVQSGTTYGAPSAATFTGLLPLFSTPPEFTAAPAIYNACRLNALSVLFQNTTAVLSKEGSVEGVCVPLSTTNPPIISTTFNYSTLANDVTASCRYNGLLEKGLYTFTVPDSQSAQFRDCVQKGAVGASGETIPLLNLDSFDYGNVIRFTDYGTPATNLFVSVDVHHEFRNTTMLWPVDISRTPLEEWHKAQVVVQGMVPFFENPTHLLTIARLARVAAQRLYPYVKPIASAALAAARDKLISMAGKALVPRLSNTPQVLVAKPGKKKAKAKAKRKAKK